MKNALKNRKLETRIAGSQDEVEKALELRYEIFNREWNGDSATFDEEQKDRDRYDAFCDHLIVTDSERDDRVVGTYRILRRDVAAASVGFYSETEFDLQPVYELSGGVAEVGRSCVHPEYRDGSVISSLWAGMARYIEEHQIRYLIGCASVHSSDSSTASEIFAFLSQKGHLASDSFFVRPHAENRIAGFESDFRIDDYSKVLKRMPPLLKGYLRLGAKVAGYPAFDPVFRSLDFFILFDSDEISRRYKNRFIK